MAETFRVSCYVISPPPLDSARTESSTLAKLPSCALHRRRRRRDASAPSAFAPTTTPAPLYAGPGACSHLLTRGQHILMLGPSFQLSQYVSDSRGCRPMRSSASIGQPSQIQPIGRAGHVLARCSSRAYMYLVLACLLKMLSPIILYYETPHPSCY